MSRTRPLALAAAALGLAFLTGCGGGDTSAEPPKSELNDAGVPIVPSEGAHIHGMAVNAADGLVYLGTHGGIFVVDEESVARVGDSTIDLMGFTAAGPDHFYSSGHPGPGDDLPEPVGLIESTDGGETWEPLSMTGEADFHTLGAAGDQVYGYYGQLVATANGRDWTAGARDVAPVSLAVDPDDSARVVATTEHGPSLSTDSAATFTHLDGAPLLYFVAWAEPDALWGVSPEGTIHLSDDGGKTWTEKGDVDAPVAFTAGQDGTVVVATQSEILSSDDGGETFEPIAEITAGGH